MCGVIGGFGGGDEGFVKTIAHRGPDAEGFVRLGRWWLGHSRLSIIDVDSRSDQPFVYGPITLSYNGELWNYKRLKDELMKSGKIFTTEGDTEVVAAAFDKFGISALDKFNGMFALAFHDDRTGGVVIARDRYGEVPLHVSTKPKLMFSSEVKSLIKCGADKNSIWWVLPGKAYVFDECGHLIDSSSYVSEVYDQWNGVLDDREDASRKMRSFLSVSCRERSMTDVPACTLLSGGIDSTIIAHHLKEEMHGLTAFTAVMDERSRDLRLARIAASELGIDLIEVRVPEPSPDDLSEVVRVIEMHHKAQVEIGWACLCLAKEMSRRGFKVTFSGEGSDELWASYGMSYHGIKNLGWDRFRRKLFYDQHRKNFARCNKIFMSFGVECRLPFLNPGLVEYALSLSKDNVRMGSSDPKMILKKCYAGVINDLIIKRPKAAFQDQLGIKDSCASAVSDPEVFYKSEFAKMYGRIRT